jgi:hypothetical protein
VCVHLTSSSQTCVTHLEITFRRQSHLLCVSTVEGEIPFSALKKEESNTNAPSFDMDFLVSLDSKQPSLYSGVGVSKLVTTCFSTYYTAQIFVFDPISNEHVHDQFFRVQRVCQHNCLATEGILVVTRFCKYIQHRKTAGRV